METLEYEMHCQKCNGKMVHDIFYDFLDDTGKYRFNGWRCLVCGDIVDPVIVGNRKIRTHLKPKTLRNRKYTVY